MNSIFQPIIIIGAPRSGTNMLRDILAGLPSVSTWPCDEINYIWRYGNRHHPNDELKPSMANDAVKSYISSSFAKLSIKTGSDLVLEKTCANCLRVDFVSEILPTAKYIHIVRNGFDATLSARQRWSSGVDMAYLFAKARYIPKPDIPYYLIRFIRARLSQAMSVSSALPTWGPVFHGMDELASSLSLTELCFLQWKRCVDMAHSSLRLLDQDRVFNIRYEDFVNHPMKTTARLASFIGVDVNKERLDSLCSSVRASSVGKGVASLTPEQIGLLSKLSGSTMHRHGYL